MSTSQLQVNYSAEVPGPLPGTRMTLDHVQTVGSFAYMWGWPLINMVNRAKNAAKLAELFNPVLEGGMPIAYGRLAMLTGGMNPKERLICCPSHDIAYGSGVFDALDKNPIVFQIPDFGKLFWIYALYDARTDEFSRIGKQYGTKPGFYLMVGPGWNGDLPDGITDVVRSTTNLAIAIPRIFTNDTPPDDTQKLIDRIDFYPLSEFDGTMKIHHWEELPTLPPCWRPRRKKERRYVKPRTFFDELPAVMANVPELPGEKALYKCIDSVLEAAAEDCKIRMALRKTARKAERDTIAPLMQWSLNGSPAGNGWNTSLNSGQWGTDYYHRTATAKSNMFENRREETAYYYTDNDSQGKPLNGQNSYAITFPTGQVLRDHVKGFWSLTLYNECHFFYTKSNPLNRYSLGTKGAFKN